MNFYGFLITISGKVEMIGVLMWLVQLLLSGVLIGVTFLAIGAVIVLLLTLAIFGRRAAQILFGCYIAAGIFVAIGIGTNPVVQAIYQTVRQFF